LFALKRILVPTNLGEPSKAAIKYGVAFARQFNAKLYVARVLSDKAFDAAIETERVIETLMPEAVPGHLPNAPLDIEDIARNAAREELGALLDPQEQQDTRAEYLLRDAGSSHPGDEIAAFARDLDVELIVMGKHRLGLVERLLAGSVTERLIRQAPCPVLIVQHPEHEFVVEDGSLAESGTLT
jgi:nucleotide-binding universal stress UspA family protein